MFRAPPFIFENSLLWRVIFFASAVCDFVHGTGLIPPKTKNNASKMSTELSAMPSSQGGGGGGGGGCDVETGAGAVAALHLPPEPVIGQGFLKPVQETTLHERAAGGVAAGAVVTALVAMIWENSSVVLVAGILSIITGPYCYYQQTRLTDIRTLQQTQHVLQTEVDKLEASNKKLVQNIDTMTVSVDRLEEIDQALQIIGSKQGLTVQAFEQQVRENKKILQQMRGNLQANVLQNLLSIILRSDTDKNFTMEETEIDALIRRLQNISGVTVHAERFRAAIAGQNVNAVMEIVKNLLRPNVPPEERIFEIQRQE